MTTTGERLVTLSGLDSTTALLHFDSITAGGGGGGLTIKQDERLLRIEKFLRNKQITDPSTGLMTVYEDDGTTVLASGALKEDAAGVQPYRGQGAERRERLA